MYLSFVFIILVVVSASASNVDNRDAFDQDLYKRVLDPVQCRKQLLLLANSTLGLRFLDASGRLPSGIAGGHLADLGDYNQCLRINEFRDGHDIRGKYCTVRIPLDQNPIVMPEFPELPELPDIPWPDIPWPSPLDTETQEVMTQYMNIKQWAHTVAGSGEPIESRIFPIFNTIDGFVSAVCVPEVCSPTEVIHFVQQQIPILNLTFSEYYCRLPNDKPFSPADYIAIALFSLVALLLIVSTSYDLYQTFILKRDASQVNILYRSFSVYTNTSRFLNFKSSPGALECIDGIRAISMLWVIVGHAYSLTLLGFIHNMRDTVAVANEHAEAKIGRHRPWINVTNFDVACSEETVSVISDPGVKKLWISSLSAVWVNSSPLTVDTFFLLSGVLCVYTTVGKVSRRRFLRSLHLFYLNRLLRMFPLLATVVLLQASLLLHVADGPFWQNVAQATVSCRQYWWSTLLHVQNYVNPLDLCLYQSWYLAVDVQLYIFCPIILFWLFGSNLFAWYSLATITVLSLVATTTYSFLFNFTAALNNPFRVLEFSDYLRMYYINTLTRASPFFIGMIYGYLLHLYRGRKIRISKVYVFGLWLIAFLLMAFCIFSVYPVNQRDHTAQGFDNFLNAYKRALWASAVGWMIFACVHGYGGPLDWLLSLPMWKLPARLSFAVYLLHLPIIIVANGTWMKTHYFSDGDTLHRYAADTLISFIVAFILCIAIDAPFSTLQKLLFGIGRKPSPKAVAEPRTSIVDNDKHITKTSL